jgi:hypothetical protein
MTWLGVFLFKLKLIPDKINLAYSKLYFLYFLMDSRKLLAEDPLSIEYDTS